MAKEEGKESQKETSAGPPARSFMSGAPNEDIVQNHIKIALLNVI